MNSSLRYALLAAVLAVLGCTPRSSVTKGPEKNGTPSTPNQDEGSKAPLGGPTADGEEASTAETLRPASFLETSTWKTACLRLDNGTFSVELVTFVPLDEKRGQIYRWQEIHRTANCDSPLSIQDFQANYRLSPRSERYSILKIFSESLALFEESAVAEASSLSNCEIKNWKLNLPTLISDSSCATMSKELEFTALYNENETQLSLKFCQPEQSSDECVARLYGRTEEK